jgi:site-specific recombinase XerD
VPISFNAKAINQERIMAKLRVRNGTYFLDYRINGKRKRKAIGPSKKMAELALKDLEVKIAKNELGFEAKDQDLTRLFKEFLTYSKTNHAPSSHKRYCAIIKNFENFLSYQPYLAKISHLNPRVFEEYKTSRKLQGVANKTINIELQTLRAMFNLAVKWGYTKDNPSVGVSTLREDNHKKPRFLSAPECKKLLANCGDKLYPIFFTFLYTGMRKGELENLEWNDIDFSRRKVKIRVKDGWRPKTTEREIPMNDALYQLLLKHQKTAQRGSYVFNNNGERIEPNSLRKKLISICKECGFPDVTKLHTLRHTFASQLVMKGVDLPTVKKLMGHSDIETTMIYSHLADEHVDKAVEKLNF